MEYDFLRNMMSGTYIARFSMEHAALGQWFSDELGSDKQTYEKLCDVITKLQSGHISHWRLIGKELSIALDIEQVHVFANVLDEENTQDDVEMADDMSFYDDESQAFCGLEDFENVLHRWREFIDER